jgi:RNA polymerase sigma factor (sigma-70 family)
VFGRAADQGIAMTARRSSGLGRVFLERYDNLKARLTRRLGSADLAGDVMQDTWLRLQDTGSTASVRQSDAYLYTIAINIALDRLRAEARRLTTDEVEALIEVPDDAPDQMQIAEDRSEWRLLETIMLELPPRRRDILLAARLDDMPRAEIAKRFGISVRLVQRELLEAQDYCAARLNRSTLFTSRPVETSPIREVAAARFARDRKD